MAISADHQAIGLNIQKLRTQHDMAQIDLAAELNVSKTTIVSIEHGESDFGIGKLISACELFDVSPSAILPARLKPENDLEQDIRKLAERLSGMTPYQRSQCLNLINAVIDMAENIAK